TALWSTTKSAHSDSSKRSFPAMGYGRVGDGWVAVSFRMPPRNDARGKRLMRSSRQLRKRYRLSPELSTQRPRGNSLEKWHESRTAIPAAHRYWPIFPFMSRSHQRTRI